MKIVRKQLDRNGPGSVKMVPIDSDDLWHAFNLIAPGDTVMAVTVRKVIREMAYGGRDAERRKLKLEIKVEEVADYDKVGSLLRIRGKNILENEYVKIGAYHTLELELNRPFVLRKDVWDTYALDVLHQASGFMTPTIIKRLYCLLLQLSLSEELDLSKNEAVLTELNKEFTQSGFKGSFQDFCGLADFLFKELDRRFKQVFHDLRSISFSLSPELSRKDNDLWNTIKEFLLLLRSCLVILTLVAFEQNALLEKGGVLLSLLRELLYLITSGKEEKESIGLEKSFSHECRITESDCTTFVSEDFVASLCILEPTDPCHPFICAVLEVFVDELLMHKSLREYFRLVDSASSNTKMVFMHNLVQDGIGTVLEVISAHFILSVSDEQAFHNFLNRLYWGHYEDLRVPELSVTTSLSLLLNPVILSAPKLFQAHFISQVSEVIGIGVFLKSPNPDHRLMNWYLVAFERAIMLYNRHMSNSYMKDAPLNSNGCFSNSSVPWNGGRQPFESYIQQVRQKKIDNLISKYENTVLFFREKSELLALSILYVEENQHIFYEQHKDDLLSILHCIILGAFQDDVNGTDIYKSGYTSHHDIYLLASILKLMSSSLLPAVWCLRHHGIYGGLKTLRDVSSSTEYGLILNIISCFQEFDTLLPNQILISEVMKSHPERHKNSKWMFLHFTGLLALSFSRGFDFLVKDCVLAIMTALNLFVFEEGNLDALSSLVGSDKAKEGLLGLKSSERVAVEFRKIQTIHISCFSSLESLYGLKNIANFSLLGIAQATRKMFVNPNSSAGPAGMEWSDHILPLGDFFRNKFVQPSSCSSNSLKSCHRRMHGDSGQSMGTAPIHNSGKDCTIGVEEAEETCGGEIFLKCLLEDSKGSSSYEDIADFVECKRGKDYMQWMKNRQKYRKWKSQKLAVLKWKKKKKIWKCIKTKNN